MEGMIQLVGFFNDVSKDHRISPTHISLYLAIFISWTVNGCQNPLSLQRAELMRAAKINSRDTYYGCLKDLDEFGYVRYSPSFRCSVPSQVFIVPLPVI